MESLKTLAVIYGIGNDREFKDVLDKLTFDSHCFTFIRIDPKSESTYSLAGGEISKVLRRKLDAAQELYVINPKGSIAHCMYHFLEYAEETGKPVRYMYKFCYKDCKYFKSRGCSMATEYFFIPDFHKLLPACENYTRVYDDLLTTSRKEPMAKMLAEPEPDETGNDEVEIVAEVEVTEETPEETTV